MTCWSVQTHFIYLFISLLTRLKKQLKTFIFIYLIFSGCSLIRFNNKNVYTTLRTVTPKKDDQKTIIGKIMDYHYCEADHFFSYLDCESSWVTIDGVPFSFDTGNSLLVSMFFYFMLFMHRCPVGEGEGGVGGGCTGLG